MMIKTTRDTKNSNFTTTKSRDTQGHHLSTVAHECKEAYYKTNKLQSEKCQSIAKQKYKRNSLYIQASLMLVDSPKYASILKEQTIQMLSQHRRLFIEKGEMVPKILQDIRYSKRSYDYEIKALATLLAIPIMTISQQISIVTFPVASNTKDIMESESQNSSLSLIESNPTNRKKIIELNTMDTIIEEEEQSEDLSMGTITETVQDLQKFPVSQVTPVPSSENTEHQPLVTEPQHTLLEEDRSQLINQKESQANIKIPISSKKRAKKRKQPRVRWSERIRKSRKLENN